MDLLDYAHKSRILHELLVAIPRKPLMPQADNALNQKNYLKIFLYYWLPVLAYMSGITYLSSLSSPEEQLPLFVPLNDKVIHATEYAILGILCFRAFENTGRSLGANHAFFLAVVTATLFGLSDEFHQWFVPLREADPLDFLADSIGATLGIIIWVTIRKYYQNAID